MGAWTTTEFGGTPGGLWKSENGWLVKLSTVSPSHSAVPTGAYSASKPVLWEPMFRQTVSVGYGLSPKTGPVGHSVIAVLQYCARQAQWSRCTARTSSAREFPTWLGSGDHHLR